MLFYMHHPTDMITHTTAFVTPVVEHWLKREIAQWVHHEGHRMVSRCCWGQRRHLVASTRSWFFHQSCAEESGFRRTNESVSTMRNSISFWSAGVRRACLIGLLVRFPAVSNRFFMVLIEMALLEIQ